MPRRKLVGWVIILVVAFGLLAPIAYFFWTRVRGVYLAITNNTSDTLDNVEIAYTGGVIHIPTLPPGSSRHWHIQPSSESDVDLKWVDPSGKEHSHHFGVYLEPHYTGSLRIAIEPNDMVSSVDKTRPYFF